MDKKFIIIISLLLSSNLLFSYSARNQIHKYGFGAYGNDISGLYYNPATIFHLSKSLSQFVLSTDDEFKYNSFYMGYYLTRFPFLSRYYWTSINLGMGMDKVDDQKNYSISLGGTFIRFLKYGITYKYVHGIRNKYHDFDAGLLIRFFTWLDLGFSAKNLSDQDVSLIYIPGLLISLTKDIHLTAGTSLDKKFKKCHDYSGAVDINIIRSLYILGSIHEKEVTFGLGHHFNYGLENIYLTSFYNKKDKEFTKLLLSYQHKFHNPFYSSKRKGKKTDSISEEDDDEMVRSKLDIIKDQKFYLKKAKFYYAQQRISDTKKMLYKVINLDKNTKYGKEAQKMLKKIKRIEKKLRRNK